jgi:hypothetical protein
MTQKATALPAVSHWTKEPFVVLQPILLDRLVFTLDHRGKECLKTSPIILAPVIKASRPVFRLLKQKPSWWCVGKSDWSCVRKLPVHNSHNFQSVIEKNTGGPEIVTPDVEGVFVK